VKAIYDLFQVSASRYWQGHYQFDKESTKKKKALSKSFVDLIIINTVVPIQFAYAKSRGIDITEGLIQLLNEVVSEKNAIMDKFRSFGVHPVSAFETQALLQLKNEYCSKSRCLECNIGIELMKTT
jgi:hypothetical protein